MFLSHGVSSCMHADAINLYPLFDTAAIMGHVHTIWQYCNLTLLTATCTHTGINTT